MNTINAFVQHNQAVRFVNAAGAMLLIYDYLLTLSDKINLVWHAKWNTGKILFFATRYLIFADISLLFIYLFHPDLRINSCKEIYNISAYLTVAGILVAEIILSMRTYALWGRTRLMLYSTVVIVLLGIITIIVVYVKKANVMFWDVSPVPNLVPCNAEHEDNVKIFIAFGLLMAWECVILILTLWIGVKQWNDSLRESPLLIIFYRDGVLYFSCLFAVSMANFVIRLEVVGNGDYYDLLITVQRVLHSVLSARMILNLRAAATHADGQDQATSTVRFASRNAEVTEPGQMECSAEMSRVQGSVSVDSEQKEVQSEMLENISRSSSSAAQTRHEGTSSRSLMCSKFDEHHIDNDAHKFAGHAAGSEYFARANELGDAA